MKPAILYYRVNTKGQEESGLGLEAQQAEANRFLVQHKHHRIAEYTETESGRRESRQELLKAIAHAKRSKAVLVVAKLDRLARNVHFTSSLLKSQVDFVACDNPYANKLTIHILAAVAEDEADRISARTKAALAAYRARGGVLGAHDPRCRKLSTKARLKGQRIAAVISQQKAAEAYTDIVPQMLEWRKCGESLTRIAARLNEAGHTTRMGRPWYPCQVKRVLDRA